jgi:hypothetical protein
MHERAADTVPLVVRPDGQRAEREDGVLADVAPAAEHVADDLARGGDRDQGQRREPGGAGPELVDQPGLGYGPARWPTSGERGGRDGADGVGVAVGNACGADRTLSECSGGSAVSSHQTTLPVGFSVRYHAQRVLSAAIRHNPRPPSS